MESLTWAPQVLNFIDLLCNGIQYFLFLNQRIWMGGGVLGNKFEDYENATDIIPVYLSCT